MRPFPLLIALAACQTSQDTAGIEITGYLDGSRISVTEVGPAVDAVLAVIGESGAVVDATEITIRQLTTDETLTLTVGPDGDFAGQLTGGTGDLVNFAIESGDTFDQGLAAIDDFPATVAIHPHPPDAGGLALFTMELPVTGLLDFVLAAPARSLTSPMHATDPDGLLWEGAIPAHTGDTVWLTGFDAAHHPTRALAFTVP